MLFVPRFDELGRERTMEDGSIWALCDIMRGVTMASSAGAVTSLVAALKLLSLRCTGVRYGRESLTFLLAPPTVSV